MPKRPVWMIIAHFYPVVGGAERQAQRVSRLLIAEHGLNVSVLTRRDSPRLPAGLPDREQIDGIPVIRLMSRAFLVEKMRSFSFMVSCLGYLFRHGRGNNYHAHDEGVSAWIAVIARFLFGGRAILKMRVGRKTYEQRNGLRKWLLARLLSRADVIVVVSRDMTTMLREWGIPAERIAYVPNGVDTGVFSPGDDSTELRVRLDLPQDVAIALFVGRLHHDKGADLLLKAWSRIPADVRWQMHLVIVGDGPETERIHAMIQTLQLVQSVSLMGEKENVLDYYRTADFLVQPARADGLSNTMLEAMACGVPVIIAQTAGALDLIEPERNGLYFTYGDTNSLAQAICQMMELKPHWRTMGSQARQTVVAQTDVRRVAEMLGKLYV